MRSSNTNILFPPTQSIEKTCTIARITTWPDHKLKNSVWRTCSAGIESNVRSTLERTTEWYNIGSIMSNECTSCIIIDIWWRWVTSPEFLSRNTTRAARVTSLTTTSSSTVPQPPPSLPRHTQQTDLLLHRRTRPPKTHFRRLLRVPTRQVPSHPVRNDRFGSSITLWTYATFFGILIPTSLEVLRRKRTTAIRDIAIWTAVAGYTATVLNSTMWRTQEARMLESSSVVQKLVNMN